MEFLKKHYEKIVLCVVLLGLAGAALWVKSIISRPDLSPPVDTGEHKTAPPKPMELGPYLEAMAQVTNPPPLVLSGAHNLFNPVTWKRRSNGDLLKILKTGPDALTVTAIEPRYTFVKFDRPSGEGMYAMVAAEHVEPQNITNLHKTEYVSKDKKPKSGLYLILGIKGAPDNPDELNLEITQTGDTNVWISKDKPYQQVDSYLADLKYEPEAKNLTKVKVGDLITLDNEQYKIVEITNNAVRVQSSTTKVTEIKWTESPKKD